MKLRNKKTGETINGGFVVCEYKDGARFSVKDKPCFDSLAELKEEWEDYKPIEPLIKDEKIRKAVRAWAEAEDEDCYYCKDAMTIYNGSGDNIEFWSEPFENLEKDRHYTITELCGEG